MKILHIQLSRLSLPPKKYGGTERVIWSLAQAQQWAGHEVKFLWRAASQLPDNTIIHNPALPLAQQIGDWPDIVHFHWPFKGELHKPFVCTEHGNTETDQQYSRNTIFLSQRHAQNFGADCFVHNGLDWRDYGEPDFDTPLTAFSFLAKARQAQKI